MSTPSPTHFPSFSRTDPGGRDGVGGKSPPVDSETSRRGFGDPPFKRFGVEGKTLHSTGRGWGGMGVEFLTSESRRDY